MEAQLWKCGITNWVCGWLDRPPAFHCLPSQKSLKQPTPNQILQSSVKPNPVASKLGLGSSGCKKVLFLFPPPKVCPGEKYVHDSWRAQTGRFRSSNSNVLLGTVILSANRNGAEVLIGRVKQLLPLAKSSLGLIPFHSNHTEPKSILHFNLKDPG